MVSECSNRGLGKRGEGGVARFFFAWGFLIWLAATVVFRLFGQFVLVPGDELRLAVVYLLTVPGIAAFMHLLYASKGLDGRDCLLAAACAVLPGMLLDVLAFAFFGVFYPNMQLAAAPYFGAFLLWAYVLVLLTGLFRYGQAGRDLGEG